MPPENAISETAPAMSQRESAKHGRRRRIVEAACALLRETGIDEVSGKLIADRADVSLSTVYNLFGSKDAVLIAVFDEDLARYEGLIRALPPQSALDRLFQAVDVAAELYREDPAFYRAILWRRPAPTEAIGDAVRQPRNHFWRALVQQALDEGQLRSFADASTIATLLIRHFSAALSDWIADEITPDQLQTEVKLGFATVLLPFASRREAAALKARLFALHDALAQCHQTDDSAAAKKDSDS